MRILQRIIVLFIAVMLLLPYIAFAVDSPTDFIDGEDTAIEQSNEQSVDGVIQEDEALSYTGDGEREQDIEDTDSEEDEAPSDTGGENAVQRGGRFNLNNVNSSDFVGGQEEFEEWVACHTDENNNFAGGSVTLGANIILKRHILLSGPLHIDTGAYGLTIDGGSISAGDFSITGEGVDFPVLTIENIGLWSDTWDSRLPSYNVTALGRDGTGGVAVRVSTDNDGSSGTLESQGHISSKGEGAVGVEFEYPVMAHYLTVSVDGENSAAIKAPDGTSLYYCKLEASGEGSKIISDGDILLDTCNISGNAGHADVVNRKIVAQSGNSLYWPLAQDRALSDSSFYRTFYYNTVPLHFLLSGDGTHPSEVRWIPVQWDRDAMNGLDTSAIGNTIISGELYNHYQGLGLEDGFSLDLSIDVMESDKPCISSIKFGSDYDDDNDTYIPYAIFITYDLYEDWFKPENGNFILWRSDGEDEDWYDFTDSPDILLTDSGIKYYYGNITSPVWFRIQKIDGDFSNIAAIYGYEGKTLGSLGGDRTGVDRGGEDPVPAPAPEPKPNPETKPNSSPRTGSASARLSSPPPDTQPGADITFRQPDEIPVMAEVTVSADDKHGDVPALPKEWENDTTAAISGKRLRMMMDTGNNVTFIKNAVRLSFESSELKTLDIGDNQLFIVKVEHLEQTQYTVTVSIGDTVLYDLPCAATLGSNKRNILVSGTYDLSQQPDEPDITPALVYPPPLVTVQPPQSPADGKTTTRAPVSEDNPFPWPVAIFALFGTGCAVGTAAFVKLRVKRHEP